MRNPNECPYCCRGYDRPQDLGRHMKRVHGVALGVRITREDRGEDDDWDLRDLDEEQDQA